MKNKKHLILRQIRDLFFMAIVGLFISFLLGSKFTLKSITYSSVYGALMGFTLWKGNEFLGHILGQKFSWKENPTRSWLMHISILLLFSLIDIFVVNYFWFTIIRNVNFLKVLVEGKWILFSEIITTFIFILIFYTINFYKLWRSSMINEEKIKNQVLALQYESLKNQVNPHFLFNSFNTLSLLIEKDKHLAIKFLKQLSDVYRYVLNQKDSELVDLSTEMEFVKSYIYLQQIRHNENLRVNIDLSPESLILKVVPLSIQMLVENAIKHNIISKEQVLTIDIYSDNLDYIIVKNNLQVKSMIKNSNKLGLANIKSRYEFLSNKKVEVIQNANDFIVKIPLIKVN